MTARRHRSRRTATLIGVALVLTAAAATSALAWQLESASPPGQMHGLALPGAAGWPDDAPYPDELDWPRHHRAYGHGWWNRDRNDRADPGWMPHHQAWGPSGPPGWRGGSMRSMHEFMWGR